jgi:hypothetical protein
MTFIYNSWLMNHIITTIKTKLIPGEPLLCIGENLSVALVVSAIECNSNVVVLCSDKQSSFLFIKSCKTLLRKWTLPSYVSKQYDRVTLENKTISCYTIGLETYDVFIDDDVEYLMMENIENMHPIIVKGIIDRKNTLKIVCTSKTLLPAVLDIFKETIIQ